MSAMTAAMTSLSVEGECGFQRRPPSEPMVVNNTMTASLANPSLRGVSSQSRHMPLCQNWTLASSTPRSSQTERNALRSGYN